MTDRANPQLVRDLRPEAPVARGSMPDIPIASDSPARMTMLPSAAIVATTDSAAPMRMTMRRTDG